MDMSVIALFISTLTLPVIFASGCPSDYVALDATCLQVVIAAKRGEFPVSWDDARAGCHGRGGELVSLSPPELLEVISKHIETEWPGPVAKDYHFWVGGHKVGNEWRWLNGDELSVNSSFPLPLPFYPSSFLSPFPFTPPLLPLLLYPSSLLFIQFLSLSSLRPPLPSSSSPLLPPPLPIPLPLIFPSPYPLSSSPLYPLLFLSSLPPYASPLIYPLLFLSSLPPPLPLSFTVFLHPLLITNLYVISRLSKLDISSSVINSNG
ncbi:hypothetical protein C7M84_007302 [Penaeus vannamei]|uniref:C-type lectin domain-containing protein n=1 Tax=Penaeus vannamei TaxID=6689 RepID=A0A423TCU1_PENVA|nr:hypothetical protein C7M84_007302 [Penaeus vannamei]